MKLTAQVLMMLGCTVCCGCGFSSRGGGLSGDEGFRIGVPILATTVRQGESQTVTVSLHRENDFKRDVRLEIKPSKGIEVDPTDVLVKGSGDPDIRLRITANVAADLGEYRVYVRGTPETGDPTSAEFTVKVVGP